MEQSRIDRINELAKKAKQGTLTPGEERERAALRREYLADFRAGFQAQLENTVVVQPDGTRRRLQKKQPE